MVCPNCGKELKNDDLFCSKCGTKRDAKESEPVFSLPHRYVLSLAKKFFDLENTSYLTCSSELFCIKRSMLDKYDYVPTKLPFLHSPPVAD